MGNRPDIVDWGQVRSTVDAGRLYKVVMANGHEVYGIVERKGPQPPADCDAVACRVQVEFSPYDMGKCKILVWEAPRHAGAGAE